MSDISIINLPNLINVLTFFHLQFFGMNFEMFLKNNFYLKFKTMLITKCKNPSICRFTNIFDDLFETAINPSSTKTPVHDVIENDKEFIVELLLAGVKKEDISIDIDMDVLMIKAERKEVKDLNYNRKETYFGKYERSFILPDDIDEENIQASLNDGILKLIIPKIENINKISKKMIEIT